LVVWKHQFSWSATVSIPVFRVWHLVAIVALMVLPACDRGPRTGILAGQVQIDGQPAAGLLLSATLPGQGVGASAVLDAEGRFAIATPVPVGTYVVTVNPPVPDPPGPVPRPAKPFPVSKIPAKYRLDSTTDLRADVKEGPNSFTFELHDAR
jgi:hypothetical protein